MGKNERPVLDSGRLRFEHTEVFLLTNFDLNTVFVQDFDLTKKKYDEVGDLNTFSPHAVDMNKNGYKYSS